MLNNNFEKQKQNIKHNAKKFMGLFMTAEAVDGLLGNIRWRIRSISGRQLYFKKQINIKTETFGSIYGGYSLTIPKSAGRVIVVSIGIGEDCSFDVDVMERLNACVYAFDPTPKAIKYIESQALRENFHFFPYGVSDKDGEVDFFLPKETAHVSASELLVDIVTDTDKVRVQMRKLSTLLNMLDISKIDIIKMDIEGSEYLAIPDILDSGIEFEQLCFELHQRFFPDGKQKTSELFEKLNNAGYYIAHVTPNGEVVTFVKPE